MQHQAAHAYQQIGRQTLAPRDLEANLLSKSAANLQRLRDGWDDAAASELSSVLLFNRRLWSVFMTSVMKDDSVLPADVKQNIANLGIFVMSHTLSIQTTPLPQKLDVLISINRELAAGLRASVESAA